MSGNYKKVDLLIICVTLYLYPVALRSLKNLDLPNLCYNICMKGMTEEMQFNLHLTEITV
jgi:hypothetical protein